MPNVFNMRPSTPRITPGGSDSSKYSELVEESLAPFGYTRPTDLTNTALVVGIGNLFFPSEFPTDAARMPDVGFATKLLFVKTICPNIEKARRINPKSLKGLARHVGQLVGSLYLSSKINVSSPFSISANGLTTDGITEPFQLSKNATVIDFGMGLSGLVAHKDQLKRRNYNVLAVQENMVVATALQGVIDSLGIPDDTIEIADDGMERASSRLVLDATPRAADFVIASRVHGAGLQLRSAVAKAPLLLRRGGIVLARGPSRYAAGYDYTKVLQQMQKTQTLQIIHRAVSKRTTPTGAQETNLTIVARKK